MVAKKLGAKNINLANAWNFSDSLSIAPIAAQKDEAIVIAGENANIEGRLSQLKVENIRVIGGEKSISPNVFNSLKKKYNVSRVSGKKQVWNFSCNNKRVWFK